MTAALTWRAGPLGRLLRLHSPGAHGLARCWCQNPRGEPAPTTERHPAACRCRSAANDHGCPTRWNGLIGATNCRWSLPHRGHPWSGVHPWGPAEPVLMRCRGLTLRQAVRRWRT